MTCLELEIKLQFKENNIVFAHFIQIMCLLLKNTVWSILMVAYTISFKSYVSLRPNIREYTLQRKIY